MTLTRRSSLADKRALTRTFGWVTAWLVAGGALALLLLANSVQSYLFVSRLVTVQQVRQKLSEDMVDLEQRLRRAATPEPSLAGPGASTPSSSIGRHWPAHPPVRLRQGSPPFLGPRFSRRWRGATAWLPRRDGRARHGPGRAHRAGFRLR